MMKFGMLEYPRYLRVAIYRRYSKTARDEEVDCIDDNEVKSDENIVWETGRERYHIYLPNISSYHPKMEIEEGCQSFPRR